MGKGKSKKRKEVQQRKKKVNGQKPPESKYAIKRRKRFAKLRKSGDEPEND